MSHQWDASTYDRVSDPQVRWAAPVIERLDPRTRTLLDAGCGSGRVTELLLHKLPRVKIIGVDASAPMLREGARRLAPFGGRVALMQADLSRPLGCLGPVDAVFSTAVFHWITDHAGLFRNLAGMLRPGGRLVAQWGGGDNIARLIDVLRRTGDGWPGPWRFAKAEQTRRDLERAGFVEVDVWLHDDPARFDTREAFEEYLRAVCLGPHLARMAPEDRDGFVRDVAGRLPQRCIDYVRLNAVARRAAA